MTDYIGQIKSKYTQYLNGNYLFKSCKNEWIVVFERTYDTTKFNVVNIINKIDPNKTLNTIDDSSITYTVGDLVANNQFTGAIDSAFYKDITLVNAYVGPYVSWYENGNTKINGFYTNRKKDKTWTSYYKNGIMACQHIFINGVPHGTCIDWYQNGNKFAEGTYDMGKLVNTYSIWHENGKLYKQITYENGEEVATINHMTETCSSGCSLCDMNKAPANMNNLPVNKSKHKHEEPVNSTNVEPVAETEKEEPVEPEEPPKASPKPVKKFGTFAPRKN